MKNIFMLFFIASVFLTPSVSFATNNFSQIHQGTQYIIITTKALAPQFQVLADYYNNHKLYNTYVFTLQEIIQDYNYPAGTPITKEMVQAFIKKAYTTLHIKYVLLGGSINIIPIYYAIATDMDSNNNGYGVQDIPTDMYYSGLNSDWYRYPPDKISLGQHVNLNFPATQVIQHIDLSPDVLVGRAPVRTASDAVNFVNKTIQYRKGGAWRNNVFMATGVSSDKKDQLAVTKLRNDSLNSLVPLFPNNFSITTLYECPLIPGTTTPVIACTYPPNSVPYYPPGSPVSMGIWPLTTLLDGEAHNWDNGPSVHGLNDVNWGYGLVLSYVEGAATEVLALSAWSASEPETTYTELQNPYPFFMFSNSCYTASLDGWSPDQNASAPDGISIAEKLMNLSSGPVAIVGHTRGGVSPETDTIARYFFTESQKGKTIADALASARQDVFAAGAPNSAASEVTAFEVYGEILLGDPTLIMTKSDPAGTSAPIIGQITMPAYVKNTSVTLTLSATEGGAVLGNGSTMVFTGCANLKTAVPYATSQLCTVSPGEGPKTVTVKFIDPNSNFSPVYSANTVLDTTAPVTTISGINSLWHNAPVTVTLTAKDTGSGVDETYYCANGCTTPTTQYTGPFTLSSDGTYTIKYYSIDNAGNAESVNTIPAVKIDMIAPTGTIKINNGASSTNNQIVTLTLSATDNTGGSGIIIGPYDTNIGTLMKFTGCTNLTTAVAHSTLQYCHLSSENGQKTVSVQFEDVAGNWSSVYSSTITLDSVAPVTTISGIDSVWHNTPVTVTLTASDAGLGVAETYYRIRIWDGNNYTWTGPTQYTGPFTLSSDGTYTIEYYSIDNAGNVETVKTAPALKIDTTAPTGTIKINNGDSNTNNPAVTLKLSATDNTGGSGMAYMKFTGCTNLTTAIAYSTSKSCTLPSGDGQKTVSVKFEDVAGNWSSPYSSTITYHRV